MLEEGLSCETHISRVSLRPADQPLPFPPGSVTSHCWQHWRLSDPSKGFHLGSFEWFRWPQIWSADQWSWCQSGTKKFACYFKTLGRKDSRLKTSWATIEGAGFGSNLLTGCDRMIWSWRPPCCSQSFSRRSSAGHWQVGIKSDCCYGYFASCLTGLTWSKCRLTKGTNFKLHPMPSSSRIHHLNSFRHSRIIAICHSHRRSVCCQEQSVNHCHLKLYFGRQTCRNVSH